MVDTKLREFGVESGIEDLVGSLEFQAAWSTYENDQFDVSIGAIDSSGRRYPLGVLTIKSGGVTVAEFVNLGDPGDGRWFLQTWGLRGHWEMEFLREAHIALAEHRAAIAYMRWMEKQPVVDEDIHSVKDIPF